MCDLRTQAAETLLAQGHDVLSAAVRAGFSGPGRLHEALVTRRGITPGEARTGAAGVRVAYGLFDSPLGIVLLAATPRGLCSLRLCVIKPPNAHLDELRTEFPAATFTESASAVQKYADQLLAYLEQRAADFHPDVDVHGTAFQREVWAELRRIPAGEIATYSEIAERIGKPRAVRAVASACASNRIAIAIPCHRVLRKGGGLGGYAWGLEWKIRFLELEKQMRAKTARQSKASGAKG
jgi:AraC family transcriptional regulator of adaptative response/methylated-DNA-[protein]-cysteine methyltransferase